MTRTGKIARLPVEIRHQLNRRLQDGKPGKQLGEFSTVHAIDCRNENELIVSEITSWRVQKIVLKP